MPLPMDPMALCDLGQARTWGGDHLSAPEGPAPGKYMKEWASSDQRCSPGVWISRGLTHLVGTGHQHSFTEFWIRGPCNICHSNHRWHCHSCRYIVTVFCLLSPLSLPLSAVCPSPVSLLLSPVCL